MRVLLHGFGSFPLVFWHLVNLAHEENPEIKWRIILNSDHHQKRFQDLLGEENVLVVEIRDKSGDWEGCGGVRYPGDLFKDIEAQKRTFKHLPAEEQTLRALHMYKRMHDFAVTFAPTHALVSQVEGFDGKAFIAAAREAGAVVAVPTGCRNLGGYFFSPDDIESIPAYADPLKPGCMDAAAAFVKSFRESPKPAWSPATASGNNGRLPDFRKPLAFRAAAAAKRFLANPASLEIHHLRASFLNNLPPLRDSIWKARRAINAGLCDISDPRDLPAKFIFYPLQYTPESSINTPAPYYLDQLRAIDAIRFAMPSGYRLVVKEHPACIMIRSGDLVREIRKRAGVVVARYSMKSLDIVKRSSLVVSVTGTATLEALLLGKSAITLGGSLASGFLGGVVGPTELPEAIGQRLDKPIDDATVNRAVATLFSVRHEVIFASPGMPGEPVLREGNLRAYLRAFLDHCERIALRGDKEDEAEAHSFHPHS